MAQNNLLTTKIQEEMLALSGSISGLISSFRELRNPLQESHEKVPQATDQLDKINEQTEAAAHQMLDMIEKITQRDESILEQLGELGSRIEANDKAAAGIKKISEDINANLDDAFMIMDALQFQDITSQQMNHAAALLEDIEVKLNNIISVFTAEPEGDGANVRPSHETARKRAFDPNADLFDKKTDQKDIDQLFKTTGKK